MGAPAFVQQSSVATGNGTATVTLNGVTAGNTIIVLVTQASSATRTYSATNYTSAVANNPARAAAILYRENCPSGTNSITVNANTGTVAISVIAIEIGASTFENASSFTDGTNVTSHDCAAANALDSASNSFIVSGGVLNASGTVLTKNAGAVLITSDTLLLWQYQTSDSGFVDEKSTWTSSTARTGTCVSASFVGSGGGPQTITLGRATEVDQARGVTVVNPRSYTLGRATETNTPRGVTVVNPRSYALGRRTETDQVRGLTILNPRSYALGRRTETDVARGVTILQGRTVALGRAAEVDTPRGLVVVNPRSYALGRATEADQVRGITTLNPRRYTIGRVTEADTARGVTVVSGGLPPATTLVRSIVAQSQSIVVYSNQVKVYSDG